MINQDYKYKSIFVSDLHLGMNGNKVKELIAFIKDNPCQTIFLVGDIIDGWELRRKWYWDAEYNLLIQKLLRQLRKGTKIVYLVGNHDEFMESFIGNDLAGIEVCMEYSYDNILILHGHQFDGLLLKNYKWIQHIGSHAYNIILSMNIFINNHRSKLGLKKSSFSKFVKSNVKSAINYLNDYESIVSNYAKSQGFDTIICGHIHSPCDKTINGVRYLNTGDWVENMSCIVETFDNDLQLIEL
jgi:UDP-2,3-diacylglucosamine pyrophosphatase LpxH